MTGSGVVVVAPPRRVEVELVQKRMSAGRTQPLLVHARDADGKPIACVIKPRGRLTNHWLPQVQAWLDR